MSYVFLLIPDTVCSSASDSNHLKLSDSRESTGEGGGGGGGKGGGREIKWFSPRIENVDSQAKWGLSRLILKSPSRRILFLHSETLSNIATNSSYHSYVAVGFR